MQHAILSPSAASRWLGCHASVGLCATLEDKNTTEYADEGTMAHTLAAYCLANGVDAGHAPGAYPADMRSYCKDYVEFVSHMRDKSRAKMMVERRVIYNDAVYGTADCILLAPGELIIIDFKYGQGVLVSAENNAQLMCYALCAYREFNALYNIEKIGLLIYQPRRDNISFEKCSVDELFDFEDVVKQAIKGIKSQSPKFAPSAAACRFCQAAGKCSARADANIAVYDPAHANTISAEHLARLLPKLDEMIAWAKAVKGYALMAAMDGVEIPGYKLVASHGRRRWSDQASDELAKHPRAADLFERKLIGITAAKKVLGKDNEVFQTLTERGVAAPILVPEADRRQRISGYTSALEDFKD